MAANFRTCPAIATRKETAFIDTNNSYLQRDTSGYRITLQTFNETKRSSRT